MLKNRIIFISNAVYPLDNSGGGSVVIYRHLIQLKNEGHEIIFINSIFKTSHNTEFQEISIPKKKYYPPLRAKFPFLTQLRAIMDYVRLKSRIQFTEHDIVIGILGEYLNLTALKIAKKNKSKLYLFYHDDSIFNNYGSESVLSKFHIQEIFKKSENIFAVSEEMVNLLLKNGAKSVELLYPIPNYNPLTFKPVLWNENFKKSINVSFSGLIFSDLHLDILNTICCALKLSNSNLILYSQNKNSDICSILLKKFDNVIIEEFRPSLESLFNSFVNTSSALLVFYSFKLEEEHRMFTSFPSKLLEYTAVGLPIIIIAPPESSVGKWAIRNQWPLYVGEENAELISTKIEALKEFKYWNECKQRCQQISATVFNPINIHKQFIKSFLHLDV